MSSVTQSHVWLSYHGLFVPSVGPAVLTRLSVYLCGRTTLLLISFYLFIHHPFHSSHRPWIWMSLCGFGLGVGLSLNPTFLSATVDYGKTLWPKTALGRRGVYLAYTSRSQCVTKVSQDKNWSRGRGGTVPTGLFPWFARPSLLYHPGPPVQESHHPQWAVPSHISYESRKRPTGQSDGVNFLSEMISFQRGLDLCQVGRTDWHTP